MKKQNIPTYRQVIELFQYDPITGYLTWKIKPCNSVNAGDRAGSMAAKGYRQVAFTFEGVKYTCQEHMLVWLMYYKIWPQHQIDHKNHVRSENWIKNLRKADNTQNSANRMKSAGTKFKFKGIAQASNNKGQFRAVIIVKRKAVHLGIFDTIEEAALAYNKAALKHFGEFAYLNKVKRKAGPALTAYFRALQLA